MRFQNMWVAGFILCTSLCLQAQGQQSELVLVESVVKAGNYLEFIHAKLDQLVCVIGACAPHAKENKQAQKMICTLQTDLLRAGLMRIVELIGQYQDLIEEVGLQDTMRALVEELGRLMNLENPQKAHRKERLAIADKQFKTLLGILEMVAEVKDSTWKLVPTDTKLIEGLLTIESHRRFRLAQSGAQHAQEQLQRLRELIYQNELAVEETRRRLTALKLQERSAQSRVMQIYPAMPPASSAYYPTAP